MLTGHLPFQCGSMTQLMLKIANEPHPDILRSKPGFPPCMAAMIDKAPHQQPKARCQAGAEFAQDLRACAVYST